MKTQLIDDKKIQEQTGYKKKHICKGVRETQWDEESTKSKNSKRSAEKKKWPIFALQDYCMFRNSSFQAYKF